MNRSRVWPSSALTVMAIVILAPIAFSGLGGCHRSGTKAPASQPVVTVPPAAKQDDIYVYFTPGTKATDAIVEQINQARQSLEIQAYQFTSAPIAKAVLEARKRGVQITVVLDKSQESNADPGQEGGIRYSSAQFFLNQSIPVFIDRRHAIAHNKIMLIDGQTIITGSFNFTTPAEKSNAENMLILLNKPELYAAYERNFREHLKHSVPYEGAEKHEAAPARPQRGKSSRQPAPAR